MIRAPATIKSSSVMITAGFAALDEAFAAEVLLFVGEVVEGGLVDAEFDGLLGFDKILVVDFLVGLELLVEVGPELDAEDGCWGVGPGFGLGCGVGVGVEFLTATDSLVFPLAPPDVVALAWTV